MNADARCKMHDTVNGIDTSPPAPLPDRSGEGGERRLWRVSEVADLFWAQLAVPEQASVKEAEKWVACVRLRPRKKRIFFARIRRTVCFQVSTCFATIKVIKKGRIPAAIACYRIFEGVGGLKQRRARRRVGEYGDRRAKESRKLQKTGLVTCWCRRTGPVSSGFARFRNG